MRWYNPSLGEALSGQADQNLAANPATRGREDSGCIPIAPVARTVLSTFFDALEQTDGLKDQAAQLRKLVLEDKQMAEPLIRAILFPEAP
jgi:hypothetical protein